MVCELAHAFPRLRIVVARAQLKDEEVLESFGGIVGETSSCIARDGYVRHQRDDGGLRVGPSHVVGLTHGVMHT